MKARHLILPILSIILISTAAFAERFPVREEFGQTRPLGRATITDPPGGPLTLSNIGDSGEDGIEFDVGMTRGAAGPIRWMAPEALTGRGISFYVRGTDAAGNTAVAPYSWTSVCLDDGSGGGAPMYGLRLDNLDPAVTMVTLRVNDGDDPLYEGRHTVGENPLFESNSQATGASAGDDVSEETIILQYGAMKIEYAPGTRFDLPTGETLVGDQVVVEAEGVQTEMVALRLTGVYPFEPSGSVGEMIFTAWPAGMFGKKMMALGEAEVLGIGSSGLDGVDRLQVNNIGSSGLDGVACEIEDTSTAQYFALDFGTAPLAGSKLFVGGLSWDTDDVGGAPLPAVGIGYYDPFFDIVVGPDKAATVSRIEYLLDHEVTHTVRNPSSGARLYTSVQYPYRLGYVPTPEGGIGIEVLFASPVTYQDDSGIDQDCDGVRLVHPPDPIRPFHSIDGLFVRGADLPGEGFAVAGLPNVQPPEPGSPWSSVEALGSANIVVPGDGSLIVDNIDPVPASEEPGLPGVVVYADLENDSWGVTMNTRSKRPPPYRGHVTVLKALGGGGDKTHFSGGMGTVWARGDDLDTRIEYSADMSAFGDGNLVWNFYDDGRLVGSATLRGGDATTCFGCDGIPQAFSASLGHPDGRPRLIIDLPDDSAVELLGGGTKADPAMNKADLVEVVYESSAVNPFTHVAGIQIQGAGQGAFLLTDIGPENVSGTPPTDATLVFRLHPAAPNPFNPRTEVAFDLARDADIGLYVYDLRGSLVRTLAKGHRKAGSFRETWDGLDDRGRSQASGTYFFRLSGAGQEQIRKAVLVR